MNDVATDAELARVAYLVDPGRFEVAISRGALDGLKLGQRFLVFAYGPEVKDPASGENLGRIELVRGQGEVVHLQDHMATIRSVEKSPARPGKRVIRDSTMFGLIGGGNITEQDWTAEDPLPFRDIAVGDFVKPV